MLAKTLRIATRGSKLALWQANYVSSLLNSLGQKCELKIIKTQGDRVQDRFLHEIGGKGIFVKELEHAMREGEVDLAVHSLKDLPAQLPDDFHLPAILKRHDPRDAIILKSSVADRFVFDKEELNQSDFKAFKSAKIATSSLRRQSIIKAQNLGIHLAAVRGNVDTRIEKLEKNDWDAIILAAASLERLGLNQLAHYKIASDWFVPSPAQGALAIECPKANEQVSSLLEQLSDLATYQAASCERKLLALLGGDCTMPVGIHLQQTQDSQVRASACVLDYEGNQVRFDKTTPTKLEAIEVDSLAQELYEGLQKNKLAEITQALKTKAPDLGEL